MDKTTGSTRRRVRARDIRTAVAVTPSQVDVGLGLAEADTPTPARDLITEPQGDVDDSVMFAPSTWLTEKNMTSTAPRHAVQDGEVVSDALPSESRMRRLLRSLFRMPTWEQRKRTLYKQAWAVSVIAYAQLAFAMTFPHQYHRDDTTHVALGWAAFLAETFLYHTGLVVAIVAAAALWRRRWWLGGVALPVALLSVGPVWWSAAPKSSPAVAPPQVKVMSINLLMVNDDVDGMLAEIADEDPDVILLQEYSRHWHEAFQQRMLAAYPHYAGTHQEDSFGAAIYSGVPFVEPVVKQMQLGGMKLPQMRAVIELGGEPVALYNIHLLPPRRLDYTRWQRHQFADLLNLLTDEPHAIVLAGDFNFTQSSPMARDLHAAGFADAHDHAALGVGETWPVKGFMRYLPVPGLRIDHVYLSADLAAVEHRTGIGSGSDHRPVITTIARRLRR